MSSQLHSKQNIIVTITTFSISHCKRFPSIHQKNSNVRRKCMMGAMMIWLWWGHCWIEKRDVRCWYWGYQCVVDGYNTQSFSSLLLAALTAHAHPTPVQQLPDPTMMKVRAWSWRVMGDAWSVNDWAPSSCCLLNVEVIGWHLGCVVWSVKNQGLLMLRLTANQYRFKPKSKSKSKYRSSNPNQEISEVKSKQNQHHQQQQRVD